MSDNLPSEKPQSVCPFCLVISGQAPSFMIDESDLSYAFRPIPQVDGERLHALVVPKEHASKMHELSDKQLGDLMSLAKKIVLDRNLKNYNIIQNNGELAYQSVHHVHFHVIDKPHADTGLVVKWPAQPANLQGYRNELYKSHNVVGKKLVSDSEWAASIQDLSTKYPTVPFGHAKKLAE